MEMVVNKWLISDAQYEDLQYFALMEQEQKTEDWESPFPMSVRTQRDMAENAQRIVSEGIAALSRFLTMGMDDDEEDEYEDDRAV